MPKLCEFFCNDCKKRHTKQFVDTYEYLQHVCPHCESHRLNLELDCPTCREKRLRDPVLFRHSCACK
jgi:DNA-directed RNA polymerase subunit RPC12/RpoP